LQQNRLGHVWARASAGNATTDAACLTLIDNGRPDRLVGANTPFAAMAELHETINDSGVVKIRPVAAIALEPGKPLALSPDGYHVMLTWLKTRLKAGESFPLTATFEHAQPITVNVEAVGGAGWIMEPCSACLGNLGAHAGTDAIIVARLITL
jgi:periplasmic copper chaperone A